MRVLIAFLLVSCSTVELDEGGNYYSDQDWCWEAEQSDGCFGVTECASLEAEWCMEYEPIEGCESEYEQGYRVGSYLAECE